MSYEDYFEIINKSDTIPDKIAKLKHNAEQSSILNNEINKLKKETILNPSCNFDTKKESNAQVTKQANEDKDFLDLYQAISILPLNDNEEETIENLKTLISSYSNQELLITKIKLALYKEYLLYSKMSLSSTNQDEFIAYQNEINAIMTKISLLDNLEKETELVSSIKDFNHLFFLTTDNGKNVFLESLKKNIPKEYYPNFKDLLIGLINGKLKGLKNLSKRGFFELKDFKIRILFDKLSDGNYIIIDAFMKKEDTSNYYRSMLVNIENKYHNKKTYYLENHPNEEFINLHETYLAEVLTLLDNKEIEREEKDESRSI